MEQRDHEEESCRDTRTETGKAERELSAEDYKFKGLKTQEQVTFTSDSNDHG